MPHQSRPRNGRQVRGRQLALARAGAMTGKSSLMGPLSSACSCFSRSSLSTGAMYTCSRRRYVTNLKPAKAHHIACRTQTPGSKRVTMHAAVDQQRAVSKAGINNGVARCFLHSPRQWKLQGHHLQYHSCSCLNVVLSWSFCRLGR